MRKYNKKRNSLLAHKLASLKLASYEQSNLARAPVLNAFGLTVVDFQNVLHV